MKKIIHIKRLTIIIQVIALILACTNYDIRAVLLLVILSLLLPDEITYTK